LPIAASFACVDLLSAVVLACLAYGSICLVEIYDTSDLVRVVAVPEVCQRTMLAFVEHVSDQVLVALKAVFAEIRDFDL
jgi:hypothetical protein